MKTYTPSLILLTMTLAVGLTATGCGRKTPKPEAAKGKAPEELALIIRAMPADWRNFERRLSVQGTLESKVFAHVAARTDGNLDTLWVDRGDAVVAGETPLFQIDPISRQNALTIAQQNLAVAQASLKVAKASSDKIKAEARKAQLDFERYERLHQEGNISPSEFESADVARAQAEAGIAVAKAQVDLAERQVKQAEANLAIAEKNLADAKVVAPISGQVSARLAEPGEQMFVGKVVLRIDDTSQVEAAAFLPAQYYGEVEPGQTKFRLQIGNQDAGMHTVTYRSPTINPTLRTFEIKGLLKEAGPAAVPGQMATLTIVFETRRALGVPAEAVLTRAGETVVFVVEDGRAVARKVQTGLVNDGWTEIVAGLEPTDVTVTEGQTQLHEGMAVDIQAAD